MPRCLMSDTFARSLKTINILFQKFLILFQGGKNLKAIPISYRLCPCPSPVGWVAPSSVTSRARLNPALPNPVWTYTHVCIGHTYYVSWFNFREEEIWKLSIFLLNQLHVQLFIPCWLGGTSSVTSSPVLPNPVWTYTHVCMVTLYRTYRILRIVFVVM